MTGLPGGLGLDQLAASLQRWTGHHGLTLHEVRCATVDHRISAPTTRALTRVTVTASDADGPRTLRLIAKELQAARHGLPPEVPPEARAHLDSVIPWRLEADVYASSTASRMPDGLRMPELVSVHGGDDDRLTLWLEDVDPVDTPWTDEDHVRVAGLLGRLAARRLGEEPSVPPGGEFFATYLQNNLQSWCGPLLCDDELWRHPLFQQAPVAALRPALTDLVHRVAGLVTRLDSLPQLPAHGDATPMNLLRPSARPGDVVAVDWGSSTPGPIGFDVVPLSIGRAEAGTADPAQVPQLLDLTVPAYCDGLAAEGVAVSPETVRESVLLTALLRYPASSLPLDAVTSGAPVTDGLRAHAVARAEFVRTVLELEHAPAR